MDFEELQDAIIAENTFSVRYVEAWASRGVCPPPLHSAPEHPSSAILVLAARDAWANEDAPLTVEDEVGVEIQRARCEAEVRRALDSTVRIAGTDTLLFPHAQVASKLLGKWSEPPSELRGAQWSDVRPRFWVWDAAPDPDSRWLLEIL